MILECLSVATIYGITPLMEKHITQFIEIESFIILSGLIIFMCCALYMFFFDKNKLWKDIQTIKNDPILIFLLFLTAFLIYIVASFIQKSVIKKHKAYLVTSIIATYPIITVILGYLLFNEEITLTHMFGVLLIISGVVILNF